MRVSTKNSSGFSPFNCISMKDVKDKNTNKGDLRPLFDCVSSIGESIDKLHTYMDNSQEESEKILAYVKTLTDIQTNLLAICQNQIAKQYDYIPGQAGEGELGAGQEAQGQGAETPMSAEKPTEIKPKIRM